MVATLPQANTNKGILRDTRLAAFAPGRSEVQEMKDRFRSSLSYKGAESLTDQELGALAVASMALNLNPYLGEIWALPKMGLFIGRAGWVKKLDENLTANGITWSAQYLDIRPHEYEMYGIPKNAKLARLCQLRRHDQVMAYIESLERMRAALPDLPSETIISMVGTPPIITGVGYIMADETEPGQTVTKQGRNGPYTQSTGYMTWAERAEKRAFAQACKKTISLPFNIAAAGDIVDGIVVDSYEIDAPQPEGDDAPPEQPESAQHWIKNKSDRSAFWGWAKGTMKLSEADVHAALNIEHVEDFTGTKADAMSLIQTYAEEMGIGPEAA